METIPFFAAMNTSNNDTNSTNDYYGYEPSMPAAITFAVLFGCFAIVVFALNIRYKLWFLMVIPVASLMELVGFVIRPNGADNKLGLYIVSVLLILLAPTIFAMADYSLLSNMYVSSGRGLWWFPRLV